MQTAIEKEKGDNLQSSTVDFAVSEQTLLVLPLAASL